MRRPIGLAGDAGNDRSPAHPAARAALRDDLMTRRSRPPALVPSACAAERGGLDRRCAAPGCRFRFDVPLSGGARGCRINIRLLHARPSGTRHHRVRALDTACRSCRRMARSDLRLLRPHLFRQAAAAAMHLGLRRDEPGRWRCRSLWRFLISASIRYLAGRHQAMLAGRAGQR